MYTKYVNRKKEIIQFLLKNKEFISTQKLGKVLGVSDKTVQKDLKEILPLLKQYSGELERKTGKGVLLKISEENKKRLEEHLEIKIRNVEDYSPKERQRIIIAKLFFDKIWTISEICNELYITRNSIAKDIDDIEHWLKRFNIFLIKKKDTGFNLRGKEENIRAALIYYLFKIDKEISNENIKNSNFYVLKKISRNIESVLSLDEFFTLEVNVTKFLNKEKINFSDETFVSMIFSLAVSIHRIRKENYVKDSFEFNISGKYSKEIFEFLEKLAEEFKININENETAYLSRIIYFYLINPTEKNSYLYEEPLLKKIKEVSEEIVKLIRYRNLGISMSNWEKEIENYMTNLLEGKKVNATIYNYYTDEIKYTFPKVYGIIWFMQDKMYEIFGKLLNEEEVGYFTLFLNGLILKNKKKEQINAAVICNKEIGVFNSLVNRLEYYYQEVNFEYFKSFDNNMQLEKFDLIISTKKLMTGDTNYIHITPILNDDDINILNKKLSKIKKEKLSIK